jgi:integrase/recombinase XerD
MLLPETVSRSRLSLRGDAGANDPVFASRKGGPLTQQGVDAMIKRAAKKAGIKAKVSPHWLRHAHGSHAIDRGASLPEVQASSATATSRRRAAICMHVPIARAGCASIRECFFDEDE